MMSALSFLLEEFALDGSFARFGLLATTPVIFCLSIVMLVRFFKLIKLGFERLIIRKKCRKHSRMKDDQLMMSMRK